MTLEPTPPPFEWLEETARAAATASPVAVALGVFDGVHRGHQALLAAAQAAGRERGITPAALTFHPHPAATFAPARTPPLLGTLEQRAELLRAHGAERVIVARFDRAFASQPPEEFVRSVLVERLKAQAVIIGEDFRFGRGRAGDAALLGALGEKYGYRLHVVPAVFVEHVPARSTAIRQTVAGGEVEEAALLLGYPYTLRGSVVKGRQLGRTLGYPTANVAPEPEILVPGAGVYAGHLTLLRTDEEDAATFRAAISVGNNPTVAENAPRTVEAYILDGFDRDIYGRRVDVSFVTRLRPMLKLGSLDALTAQMARDVDETKARITLPHARHNSGFPVR